MTITACAPNPPGQLPLPHCSAARLILPARGTSSLSSAGETWMTRRFGSGWKRRKHVHVLLPRRRANQAPRDRQPRAELGAVGSVSVGAAVGDGAGGLLGQRRPLELFST